MHHEQNQYYLETRHLPHRRPYTYTVTNGEAAIMAFDEASCSGALSIPNSLGGYPVTIITGWAFKGCKSLTSVTIPKNVTAICDQAFIDLNSPVL